MLVVGWHDALYSKNMCELFDCMRIGSSCLSIRLHVVK